MDSLDEVLAEEADRIIAEARATADARVMGEEWDDPIPLPGSGPRALYPVDALPSTLRASVTAEAERLAIPADLAGIVALGCVATAVVGAVEVELAPGWKEPAALYLCGIASPGERKTPLTRALRAPLHAVEKERREEAAPLVRAVRDQQEVLKARRTRAITAGKLDEVRDATDELARLGDAVMPRLLVGDATPEATVGLMAENRGRIGFIADEGGEVFELMSRYSTTGKGNLGIYLHGWDGVPYPVDRAGSGHRDIERATMVMTLLVQPSVVRAILRDADKVGRGLPQRFLFAWPTSRVGTRPANGPPVPASVERDWDDLLHRLAAQAYGQDDPVTIHLSPEARGRFDAWREAHEPRLHPDSGDLGMIAEWGSKLPGQVGRLALALHLAEGGTLGGRVSGQAMAGAIALGEYHVSHALATFGDAGADQVLADAGRTLTWLVGHATAVMTTQEVHRNRSLELGRTRAALGLLAEHGFVRPIPRPPGRGRHAEQWACHPQIGAKTPRVTATIAPETEYSRLVAVSSGDFGADIPEAPALLPAGVPETPDAYATTDPLADARPGTATEGPCAPPTRRAPIRASELAPCRTCRRPTDHRDPWGAARLPWCSRCQSRTHWLWSRIFASGAEVPA